MQNTESHDVIALGNQPCSCIRIGRRVYYPASEVAGNIIGTDKA